MNLLIAPDFTPECFAGWHMLNTLLQKHANLAIHLLTPTSSQEQARMLSETPTELIYANPFDAAKLIREQGYRAVARPIAKANEMVIVSHADSDIKQLSDLPTSCKIAMADNRDVKLIGLRLLEAVDLAEDMINWHITQTYQAAARSLIKGEVDAAFFLADVYHGLSRMTRAQLQVLVESDLNDISHVLLVRPDVAQADVIVDALLYLTQSADGQAVLQELGMPAGFEAMTEEDGEFMIDLMETLLD